MDCARDVYAYSILLYELVERKKAWDGLSLQEIEQRGPFGDRPRLTKQNLIDPINKFLWQIMEKAWMPKPKDRPR